MFKHLADWPSRFWSVGPTFSQPIYNAALSAELHQYVAIYNADVASYRQTVLTAFQQVEDYLAQTRILSQQIQQQRAAVASAQTSLDLEMGRYQTGIDPYIDVVTLQNTVFSNQQTSDQSADRADDRRGATGGGLRRRLGYFATTHADASDGSAQQGGYEDFSSRSAWSASTCSAGCSQPQSDSVLGRRKT